MKYLSRYLLGVAVVSLIAILCVVFRVWHSTREGTESSERCPPELPAGLDPKRLVVVAYSGTEPPDSRKSVAMEDFEELLLSARYQILPASSGAGAMPARCVAWRIDLDFGERGARDSLLKIRHFGVPELEIAEKADWLAESILPGSRRAIAMRLGIGGRAGSLQDPDSEMLPVRLQAMRLATEGRTGEAAQVLLTHLNLVADDSALSFRLGKILSSWCSEIFSMDESPLLNQAIPSLRLEAEGKRRLREAHRHLDHSLALEKDSPLALFARGQTLRLAGDFLAAEKDFSRAAEIWPAYGQAIDALARSRLARGELELPVPISAALELTDSRDLVLRAALFRSQGAGQALRGDAVSAAEAFKMALDVVPAEQRRFRLEVLEKLAAAQAEIGDLTAACASWRALQELASGNLQPWFRSPGLQHLRAICS